MANVPYTAGQGPEVGPASQAPDDYQRVQANPSAFGGQIAQGMQALGAGAAKASDNFFDINALYQQAAKDDQINSAYDASTKLLYGDPNKTVVSPEGTPVPDTGFFGLQGQDAMRQRGGVLQQLQDIRNSGRQNLQGQKAQIDYDNATRRMMTDWEQKIGQHADAQTKTWMYGVSGTKAEQSINSAAANADTPNAFAAHASDYIHARVEQAQIKYGISNLSPDIYDATVSSAKRDLLKAQLQTIGQTDPQRALDILGRNREIAGTEYAAIEHEFRSRADQQSGKLAGEKDWNNARKPTPLPALTSEQSQGVATFRSMGLPLNGALPIIANLSGESGAHLNPTATNNSGTERGGAINPNGAFGLPQLNGPRQAQLLNFSQQQGLDPNNRDTQLKFVAWDIRNNYPALWRQLSDPKSDPHANLASLVKVYERPANPEAAIAQRAQYLGSAYFGLSGPQPDGGTGSPMRLPPEASGEGIAPEHMTSTDEPSSSFSAPAAPQTQATPDAPSQGAQPSLIQPTTQSLEMQHAQAMRSALDNPDYNEQQRAYAIQTINQRYAEESIASEANAKMRKEMNDKAANELMTEILQGPQPDIISRIATNPNLNWETKHTLSSIATSKTGNNDLATLGRGYADAFQRIIAAPDTPGKITDMNELLQMLAPERGELTPAGYNRLKEVFSDSHKNFDQAGINSSRSQIYADTKKRLSFEDPNMQFGLKDPKGEHIFATKFMPQYEAAYDSWVKQGKDPYVFLQSDFADKLADKLRPRSQMAMDRMLASGDAPVENPKGQVDQIVPPIPQGVSKENWQDIMQARPVAKNGSLFPMGNWGGYITALSKDPSPENIAGFKQHFPDIDPMPLLEKMRQVVPSQNGTTPSGTQAAKPESEYARDVRLQHEFAEQHHKEDMHLLSKVWNNLQPHWPTLNEAQTAALTKQQQGKPLSDEDRRNLLSSAEIEALGRKQHGIELTPEQAELLRTRGL